MVVDPHTRAIEEESYPDSALNQHQLGLVNEAVLAEIDKISSGPVPEFREATVRRGGHSLLRRRMLSREHGGRLMSKALRGREIARG